MKRIMLVCLTALAVSGTYSLYAQSSGSDFMVGDKACLKKSPVSRRKRTSSISILICTVIST